MIDLPPLAPLDSVSVYVHIPFCRSRCSYCNFYFETTRSPSMIERTLRAIALEAESYSRALGVPRAATIYLGGGTPSIIEPTRLARFLNELRPHFAPGDGRPPEITVEANPESVDDGFLHALRGAGVTRLSMGIQSFDDALLATLGRRARSREVSAALDAIERSWDGLVSADLISGIPGQSMAQIAAAVDELARREIDHVSLYALAIEEDTPLAQSVAAGRIRMADGEAQDELWLEGARRLESAGYEWYEISNFARRASRGRALRSQHNMAYWRYLPYIGLGPGAAGTLPTPEGGRVRITNRDLFRYLSAAPDNAIAASAASPGRTVQEAAGAAASAAGSAAGSASGSPSAGPTAGTAGSRLPSRGRTIEYLRPRERLFEHFICGLRTVDGVDLSRAEQDAALPPGTLAEALANEWSGAEHLNRVALGAGRAVLDRRGRLELNRLLLQLGELLEDLAAGNDRWDAGEPLPENDGDGARGARAPRQESRHG